MYQQIVHDLDFAVFLVFLDLNLFYGINQLWENITQIFNVRFLQGDFSVKQQVYHNLHDLPHSLGSVTMVSYNAYNSYQIYWPLRRKVGIVETLLIEVDSLPIE